MYPPAKSLYRAKGNMRVVLDLKQIHSGQKSVFDKAFRLYQDDALKDFMPFSVGSKQCPAAKKYVPLFVSLYLHLFVEFVQKNQLEQEYLEKAKDWNLQEIYSMNRVQILKVETMMMR